MYRGRSQTPEGTIDREKEIGKTLKKK